MEEEQDDEYSDADLDMETEEGDDNNALYVFDNGISIEYLFKHII